MSVKNETLANQRAAHIQQTVNSRSAEKVDTVIRELAQNLFLSERTVWRDYTRELRNY